MNLREEIKGDLVCFFKEARDGDYLDALEKHTALFENKFSVDAKDFGNLKLKYGQTVFYRMNLNGNEDDYECMVVSLHPLTLQLFSGTEEEFSVHPDKEQYRFISVK